MKKAKKATTPNSDGTPLSPEEQFKVLKADVDAKLAAAAALIRDAAKMAEAGGFDLHATDAVVDDGEGDEEDEDADEEGDEEDEDADEEGEDLFDIYCLEDAMGDAGWRTSNWYC